VTSIRSASLFVLIVMSAAVSVCGQSENQQGVLTINLTDTRGLQVSRGSLSIKSSQGKVVYATAAEGQAIVHLPYGRYSVEFKNEWSPPARRDVVIDKPECFLELASTFVPEGGNKPGSISIKVDPATSCTADGSLWTKLVGVYSQDVLERRIGPGGYALFEPVEGGSYVVIVVDGSKVRAALPVATTRQITTATIALSGCESK
jgi:hypothetical protein